MSAVAVDEPRGMLLTEDGWTWRPRRGATPMTNHAVRFDPMQVHARCDACTFEIVNRNALALGTAHAVQNQFEVKRKP